MLILGGRGSRPLSKRRVSIPTIRQVENKNKFGGDVTEKGRVFKRDTLKGDGQCVIRLSTAPFYICTWVSRVNAQSSLRLLLNSFPFLEFYRMFKIKNCAFLEQYSLNGGFLENNCVFMLLLHLCWIQWVFPTNRNPQGWPVLPNYKLGRGLLSVRPNFKVRISTTPS